MRTLVFVPAVGLVAALLGSPTIGSREESPVSGERPAQATITGKPTASSDRGDNRHGLADPKTGASQLQFTRIEWKPAE